MCFFFKATFSLTKNTSLRCSLKLATKQRQKIPATSPPAYEPWQVEPISARKPDKPGGFSLGKSPKIHGNHGKPMGCLHSPLTRPAISWRGFTWQPGVPGPRGGSNEKRGPTGLEPEKLKLSPNKYCTNF